MDARDVRMIRRDLGVTQREFATLVNVGINTVRRWEQGRTQPSDLHAGTMRSIHQKVMRHREQAAENNRKQAQQDFIKTLLGMAAAGAFAKLLATLFSNDDTSDDNAS